MNNDSQTAIDEGLWLGRLTKANHLYALIVPIAELIGGRWVELAESGAKFPKQGVHASPADLGPNRTTGSLWVFGLQSRGSALDKHTATKPSRALPLIDLSDRPLGEARRLLLDAGVHLPPDQGRHAVVLLEGETCSVLKFEKHGERWRARPIDGLVELQRAEPMWSGLGEVKGNSYLPLGEEPKGEIISSIDWSTDGEFLTRLVGRYRDALRGFTSLATPAHDSPIRHLETAIAEGRLGSSGSHELDAIVHRLREDWPTTSRSLAALEAISGLLLDSDAGKRLLHDAVSRHEKELRVDLERQVRHELDQRLQALRNQIGDLENEGTVKRESLANLQRDIEMKAKERVAVAAGTADADRLLSELVGRAKLAREELVKAESERDGAVAEWQRTVGLERQTRVSLDDLRSEVTNFVERLREEFEAAGGEDRAGLGTLAARIKKLVEPTGVHPVPLLPSSVPPWWGVGDADARDIPISELRGRLAIEAALHGIVDVDLALLDGFARAGELVLVLGHQAEVAVIAYARALAGGRVRRQPLDPSVIGLDDLWRVPGTGRPTAFALAWQRALARPNEAVLMCLSDFDAAPCHLWLTSLTAALRAPGRPANLLVLATACGAARSMEGYPGADDLRHRALALRPRADLNNQAPLAALDELPATTKLVWTITANDRVPPADLMDIASRGKDLSAIRRAVRFRRRADDVELMDRQAISLSWAGYLHDGNPRELPAALIDGTVAVGVLHFQR